MRLATAMPTTPRVQPEPDWELLSQGLRRCAVALTGRADEADDLAQQTLAHLLARAPEKVAHVGYARRTMTRLWLDSQRSLRRRLRRYTLVARRTITPHTSRLSDVEQAQRVRACIDALPARQRAVLVLRLIEGLDYAQIAEALDSNVSGVRANLHLARRAIARSLGDEP